MGKLFYNPISVIGPRAGLAVGLVIVVALAVVAWWGGVRLDGALDLHVTHESPTARVAMIESVISWLSLALFLFLGARLFHGGGGVMRYAAVAGLSRFPYLLSTLIFSKQFLGKAVLTAVLVGDNEVVVRPQELISPALLVGAVAVVGLIVWAIVILYLGHKEVSGLRGARSGFSFVLGLLSAEIISKLLLLRLFPLSP